MKHVTYSRLAACLLLTCAAACVGCGKEEEEKTTTPGQKKTPAKQEEATQIREDIFKARMAVDTLYLTEDGRQITAPGNRRGIIVDAESGKLAWRAWQCNNPACPGRKADGKPLLFPWVDSLMYVKEDGTVGMRQPQTEEDFRKDEAYGEQKCPACLKIRNLSAETPEERQQYLQWCQLHVLPQAAEMQKQLDEQYRRHLDEQKTRNP